MPCETSSCACCQAPCSIRAWIEPCCVILSPSLPALPCQSELTASLSKVTEEREFLRSLNETLLSNQKEFNTKLAAAQAELKDKDAQLQDLQEQVRA